MKNNIFKILVLLILIFLAFKADVSVAISIGQKAPIVEENRQSYMVDVELEKEVPISERQAFIDRFVKVCQTEQKKFGIPASIKLAQLAHESNWGNSKLFLKGNNGYGIKWHNGGKPYHGCNRKGKDCAKYQTYKTAWESIRGHSLLLQKSRYKRLFDYGKDYKKWANGLKQTGYATDEKYAEKLIRIIETYKLNQYDNGVT